MSSKLDITVIVPQDGHGTQSYVVGAPQQIQYRYEISDVLLFNLVDALEHVAISRCVAMTCGPGRTIAGLSVEFLFFGANLLLCAAKGGSRRSLRASRHSEFRVAPPLEGLGFAKLSLASQRSAAMISKIENNRPLLNQQWKQWARR
jgi:hypothetical protein